ncbi:MAG: histidine kinase dimerization/phospho-acceptor domain-containing protein [Phototrophicaceae bacterium]
MLQDRIDALIEQAQRIESLSDDILRNRPGELDGEDLQDIEDIHKSSVTLVSRLQNVRTQTPEQWPENILHELRSPLNAIVGYSDMLVESGLLATDQERDLTTVHDIGSQLTADITALFMRPDGG